MGFAPEFHTQHSKRHTKKTILFRVGRQCGFRFVPHDPEAGDGRERSKSIQTQGGISMGLFKDFVSQTRKPEGFLGKVMLGGMNSGHAKMADGV